MVLFLTIIYEVFAFIKLCLLARFIMSFVDRDARYAFTRFIFAFTEPSLAPLRWIIRPIGILDLSIIIAWFTMLVLQTFLVNVGATPIIQF